MRYSQNGNFANLGKNINIRHRGFIKKVLTNWMLNTLFGMTSAYDVSVTCPSVGDNIRQRAILQRTPPRSKPHHSNTLIFSLSNTKKECSFSKSIIVEAFRSK